MLYEKVYTLLCSRNDLAMTIFTKLSITQWGVFKTLSTSKMEFFLKKSLISLAVNYFHKNARSLMFDRVLNKPPIIGVLKGPKHSFAISKSNP